MVSYNPKDWFKLIVQFHKSDTFRILFPTMSLLGIVTWAVCFIEKKYLDLEIPTLTIFHQIAGFIISMVLVFRINTAYDRWWEGRKLWGALVNNTRNLAIKLNALVSKSDIASRSQLHSLISNFPFALKEHLRNRNTLEDIKFSPVLTEENFKKVSHKPNYIARQLTEYCLEITKKNSHTQNDYLVLSENLNQFTDICGACERIKNTPIPYSYSIFIKKMIFLYIITMPVSFGLTIGYWSIPIVMIMFYAFASLELISEEIEDPFGTDSNDLPTDELSVKIKENVREILLGDED
ncbi:bestrophin family protein [Aurantibacillus circumpalustris]|uniref:bestrophin family protein n=1 Tax=Aurantibacillus circumpalustris TaxID=3036359 RepID=UPI00295A7731|nr:bestrophin family ion channel [Aurantibacillus circumpalustris]